MALWYAVFGYTVTEKTYLFKYRNQGTPKKVGLSGYR